MTETRNWHSGAYLFNFWHGAKVNLQISSSRKMKFAVLCVFYFVLIDFYWLILFVRRSTDFAVKKFPETRIM